MTMPLRAAVVLILTTLAGCGRSQAASTDRSRDGSANAAGQFPPALDTLLAAEPSTGCDWIKPAEVEAIIGRAITGQAEGGESTCRYPLAMDPATAKQRSEFRDMARRLSGPDAPAVRDSELDRVAIILTVDLGGDVTSERAGEMAGDMLTGMFRAALGTRDSATDTSSSTDDSKPLAGWDVGDAPSGNADFVGRIGHVRITVEENVATNKAIPESRKLALAERVRDRIPDRPFRWPRAELGGEQPQPATGRSPCDLIPRADAEKVLGQLVAPPYRSRDGGPYAYPNGDSCSYFTRGHHVLVLTPTWSDGKQLFGIGGGVKSLVTTMVRDRKGEDADTLMGPWDDAMLGLDGGLSFLKGDQMIEVAYMTSSTDAAGAVKLARSALERITTPGSRP